MNRDAPQSIIQHSKKAWWFIFVGCPVAFALFYSFLALLIFNQPVRMVFEHLYVILFFLSTFMIISLLVGERLAEWFGLVLLWLFLSVQYFFYLMAVLGLSFWGDIPTAGIVGRFFWDLGNLSEATGVHLSLVFLVLLGPSLALFLLLFLARGFFLKGHLSIRRVFKGWLGHRWVWGLVLGSVFWVIGFLNLLNPDVDMRRFGHFSFDPVIRFWAPTSGILPMTGRRSHWSEKDALERAATKSQKARVRNVILVVVDSLRADRVERVYPRRLVPSIDRLTVRFSGRSIQNAFSNGVESKGGILSILTSKEVPAISHLNYTLPDFMAAQGARTWFLLSGDHHWYNFGDAYGRSIDIFKDGTTSPGPHGINDDELLVRETESLPRDDGRPHFIFYHLMSVHELGYHNERFEKYQPIENMVAFEMSAPKILSRAKIQAVHNAYDNRVLQADHFLERIFETLERKGYLESFVAVVTADHGQLLGENGRFGHPKQFADLQSIRIPMIFLSSMPLIPEIVERHAIQIDVAPTLISMAGMTPPKSWQGRSLITKGEPRWSVHMNSAITQNTVGALLFDTGSEVWKYDYFIAKHRAVHATPLRVVPPDETGGNESFPIPVEAFDRRAGEAFGDEVPSWESNP